MESVQDIVANTTRSDPHSRQFAQVRIPGYTGMWASVPADKPKVSPGRTLSSAQYLLSAEGHCWEGGIAASFPPRRLLNRMARDSSGQDIPRSDIDEFRGLTDPEARSLAPR